MKRPRQKMPRPFFCLCAHLRERPEAGHRIVCSDALFVIVKIDQDIFVIAHAELFHIGKLAESVTRYHPLHHCPVVFFFHRENDVNTGLIDGQNVERSQDTDVRGHDRL